MEYTNSQIKTLICEHIHSHRDRRILFARLVDGLTYDQLGVEFQLTPRQIKSIVYKAEKVLFAHLKDSR